MSDGPQKPVRVRIAPSPTGPLHLGTARTALFNWLFARKYGGSFIVRIEDTDLERSDYQYEKDILEGLEWLGLEWDEGPSLATATQGKPSRAYIGDYGPYRQSERLDIYEKYIKQLLDRGLAYRCFCTKEQLEAERQAMLAQGYPPKYSGRCRQLSPGEAAARLKNEPSIIRFCVPEKKISFTDLIRGKITFDSGLIGDIAIAKNERTPLYNFAVVVDDETMNISHVIRGEDHIANTPKQILIQEALGFERPHYAHLPLILSPDRSKLSKRFIETSVNDYRKDGYLPEAMINFMALLGWHPAPEKDEATGRIFEQEIFSKTELIKAFDLKRVQKQGAIFNIEKLNWLNGQYIKTADNVLLAERLRGFTPTGWRKEKVMAILEIEKERMKKLTDFAELAGFFFKLPDYEAQLLLWKETPREKILENLRAIEKILALPKPPAKRRLKEKISENLTEAETKIMELADKAGRGEVLWPLRAALSGKSASPGPFEILKILGRKEALERIRIAIKKLES